MQFMRKQTNPNDYELREEYDLAKMTVVARGRYDSNMQASQEIVLPRINYITINDDTLSVDLEDGRTISVPIGWYPRLAHGTPAERENFQISGAGYGIYWRDLDEDIGVEGMLLGKKSTESLESFERWLKKRSS
jgi:hypothetical protein